MCGRFNVIDSPGLQALLRDLGIDLRLPDRANLSPTDEVPLVRRQGLESSLDWARWWLTPAWAPRVEQKYAMFNARAETLAQSRAYRGPFQRQRGIVPMSSFIEWQGVAGRKQSWLIEQADAALAVAALWDVWRGEDRELLSCSVVTVDAAPEFRPWHHRMPLILAPGERERWLDNENAIAPDDPLFRVRLKTPLRLLPLSSAVNRSSDKSANLLSPEGEAVELAG